MNRRDGSELIFDEHEDNLISCGREVVDIDR